MKKQFDTLQNVPGWIRTRHSPIVKGQNKIPVYAPWLTAKERENVMACLSDTWISSKGNFVTEFEKQVATFCHMPHAVATNCCTNALYLAVKALGIGPGDEVIVPSFTMIATAFAVIYAGATPVFVDCEKDTGNIDVSRIEGAITKKTKAIIPVHIYGTPCDMDKVLDIAKAYHLHVIEDAAEAMGATYKGRIVGSISDISAFSFYVNKVVTTGEGGMLVLRSKRLYEYIRELNNYFFSDQRHFWHKEIGYNFRMSNLEAAVGLAQIGRIKEIVAKKRLVASWYHNNLASISDNITPLSVPSYSKSNYWHVAFLLNEKNISVDDLRRNLADHGIETRGFFIPLHLQPCFKNLPSAPCPESERLSRMGILFPSSPILSEEQVVFVCDVVKRYLTRHG